MRLAAAMAAWRRRRLAHLPPAEDIAAFDRDGFISEPDWRHNPFIPWLGWDPVAIPFLKHRAVWLSPVGGRFRRAAGVRPKSMARCGDLDPGRADGF
jgi:hypothetical protein